MTRADARLLQEHAREIVDRPCLARCQVAELGSGSGKKTRWILEALSRRQKTYYYPIEISSSALAACEKELGQIDLVSVVGLRAALSRGLALGGASRRDNGEHLLVLFLGSTIGNFDRGAAEQFLTRSPRHPAAGDALLLGTDLEKDIATQILAYDDPAGVTAAFNMNLAGAHQSRARRRLRLGAVSSRGALERRRTPHRDAPAVAGAPDR